MLNIVEQISKSVLVKKCAALCSWLNRITALFWQMSV